MRPINEIAREIIRTWSAKGKGVNYAAKPYLEAMLSLTTATPADFYYLDSAKSVVLYGLANMSGFRGEDAKRLKAELREHVA